MPDPVSRPLGVAVIGHSFMGRAHSNAWRNVGAFYPTAPAVRQQVLVGRDPTRVERDAARLGWAESATDWAAVVTREDVDIVDICTPGHLHAGIALAALRAGKHVLVEKPLANSVAEATELARVASAAARSGVRSMVGFNYRRVPALALARQVVADGRIGRVRQVRASYLQDWLSDDEAPMSWRLRKEEAGSGVLGDLGSHVVDQLHHLLGERVTSVSGGRLKTFVPERPGPDGPERVTVEDAAWATLETASGVVAGLEVSRVATGHKNSFVIELLGSTGSLRFDLESLNELWLDDGLEPGLGGSRRILVTEESHPYLGAWWPPGHVLGWDHTFTSQAADFVLAIAEGADPVPSFADGLAVQEVLAAVEVSAARGGSQVGVGDEQARVDDTGEGRSDGQALHALHRPVG